MSNPLHIEALNRLQQFAAKNDCVLKDQLGYGYDGIVYSTTSKSALKAFFYEKQYRQERNVYRRLLEKSIEEIQGFAIPKFLAHDDLLWVLEIQIVSPPYVLDFAGAYLDVPPSFPADVLSQWESEKREQLKKNGRLSKTFCPVFGVMEST